MAKLSFRNEVVQGDVDEAIKLMDFSIRSLRSIKADTTDKQNRLVRDDRKNDRMSTIINAVRELMNMQNLTQISVGDIIKKMQKTHH